MWVKNNMKLKRFSVSFEKQDMKFVKKHGVFRASRMVKKHYKKYKTPFIYDTYQLAHQLSVTHKTLFELSKNTKKHYKLLMLRKHNGGLRYINAPDSQLKKVQLRILNSILSKIEVSPYATAYIKGKNLKDNAAPHVGHKYIFKMDITDFFGSISYLQVVSAAFNSNRFPKQIGAILTSLCCLDEYLPQGAPTSPALSNIVMKNFDDILGDWCEKRNIVYTRYCDDLTFSADFPLYGKVYHKVEKMLYIRGFEINESKTKSISNSSSQRVTGLTVNEKVSIPNEYKRQLRQEIYYVLKFGLSASILRGDKKEFMNNGKPDADKFYNHIMGKLNYVLQIEPQNKWFNEKKAELSNAYTRCT